jgi:hypothetical protein
MPNQRRGLVSRLAILLLVAGILIAAFLTLRTYISSSSRCTWDVDFNPQIPPYPNSTLLEENIVRRWSTQDYETSASLEEIYVFFESQGLSCSSNNSVETACRGGELGSLLSFGNYSVEIDVIPEAHLRYTVSAWWDICTLPWEMD